MHNATPARLGVGARVHQGGIGCRVPEAQLGVHNAASSTHSIVWAAGIADGARSVEAVLRDRALVACIACLGRDFAWKAIPNPDFSYGTRHVLHHMAHC